MAETRINSQVAKTRTTEATRFLRLAGRGFQKRSLAKFLVGLLELGLRVHHDGAIPRDRFLQWLAGDQQKSDAFVPRLHGDVVTGVEQDERAVVRLGGRGGVQPLDAFGGDGQGRGGVAELSAPGKYIRERVVRGRDGQDFSLAGRNGDVEVNRVRRDAFDGTAFAPKTAADEAGLGAVVIGDFGDLGGLEFLISGGGHLEGGREVRPQLEPVHLADGVALGHLLVDDAAAGGHPLDVAGADGAAIAEAVGVFDGAGEDVSDGLDAAVRVPRETGKVIVRDVVAKIVQEQEGVEVGGVAKTERAPQMDACAFKCGFGLAEPFDGSDGHVGLSI